MSKVGFWLRGSRGKLAGSYFGKGPGGSTIQHVIGENKNPRTLAQMQQRMIMATAMAAYSGMKEIVDHSFEGVTYGQPTMSEFIRLNSKMLRDGLFAGNSNIAFNPYGNRKLYRNPYIVSKGSLKVASSITIDDIDDSNVILGWDFPAITSDLTLAGFCASLGLSVFGYLTFICISYSPETGLSQFGWVRITPKSDQLQTRMIDEEFTALFSLESNMPVDFDSDFSEGLATFQIYFDFDQGGIQSVSAGIITSDKKISWKRSTSIMLIKDNISNPSPADTALATYPVGTDYILNGGTI